MKLTAQEEAYTRRVAAQIGRDPEDLIREGEQLKEEGCRDAREQAREQGDRLAHGGRGLGAYPAEPAAVRAANEPSPLWQRHADREAGG